MPQTEDGPAEAAAGSLSITMDGALIHIVSAGFWSIADVDAQFAELRRLVAAARPQHPRFKVIVDMRPSSVQARDSAERLASAGQAIWTPDDRIALVPRAGLARMQVDRVIDGGNHRIFDSIALARQWLDED